LPAPDCRSSVPGFRVPTPATQALVALELEDFDMIGIGPRRALRSALALGVLLGGALQPWRLLAQAPMPARGVKYAQVSAGELKEWLTYLSSDSLQGRQVFTEGYGLAAGYVAEHLKAWGVKPLGDGGTYLQTVKLKGYKVTRN